MNFRVSVLIISLYLLIAIHEISGQSKPNILIIIVDDQGYADLSAYSHAASDINTPNMDRLAKEGVLFTNAYVSAPVSSPSRAGWNTGLYQQRWNFNAGWNPGLPDSVKSIAQFMKSGGYKTARIGKNDLGKGYFSHDAHEYPLNHGFDHFLGFSAHAHDFFLLSQEIANITPDPNGTSAHLGPLMHNKGYKSYSSGYTTEIFTDSAIQYLENHINAPFFLVLSYNAVHHLIHEVPKRYLDKYNVSAIPNYNPRTMGKYNAYYNKYNKLNPITNAEMRRYYLANLNCLDDNIGRVLDKMDDLGISDSTLVIYFSDNGGSPLTGANNQPLRGSKYVLFEGGLRIPFIMRWPSILPKGSLYTYRVSTLDILPTICAATNTPISSNDRLDGFNILNAVINNKPSLTHDKPLFWKFNKQIAVRQGNWKYAYTNDYTSRQATNQILQGPDKELKERLYNLAIDPSEQNNLFTAYPDTVLQLKELISQWEADLLGFPNGTGTRVDDKSGLITFSGSWERNTNASGNYLFTNTSSKTKNDKAEFTFIGTGIKLYVQKGKAAGKFDVYLDGIKVKTCDGYASSIKTMQVAFADTTLPLGSHTIRTIVRGDNNASSTNYWTNIDFFEYYDTSATHIINDIVGRQQNRKNYAMTYLGQDHVKFDLIAPSPAGLFMLHDARGRLIYKTKHPKRSVTIKRSTTHPGLYIATWKCSNSSLSHKFMILH